MPRPRTPTKVLELRGAFKNHPSRQVDREGEPETIEPIGDPDPSWPENQIQVWNEVVAECHKGVLTIADRKALEMLSWLIAEFRELGTEFHPAKLCRIQSLLGEFGMTPAARSRVVAVKPPKKSRLQEALEG